ncbi:MAG: hypothetical protein KC561_20995 [Myxococcales bacterium]|nr:hypothetical protein [Myxococcales bacterium]
MAYVVLASACQETALPSYEPDSSVTSDTVSSTSSAELIPSPPLSAGELVERACGGIGVFQVESKTTTLDEHGDPQTEYVLTLEQSWLAGTEAEVRFVVKCGTISDGATGRAKICARNIAEHSSYLFFFAANNAAEPGLVAVFSTSSTPVRELVDLDTEYSSLEHFRSAVDAELLVAGIEDASDCAH